MGIGDGIVLIGLDPVESRLARVDETDDELFLVEGFDASLELWALEVLEATVDFGRGFGVSDALSHFSKFSVSLDSFSVFTIGSGDFSVFSRSVTAAYVRVEALSSMLTLLDSDVAL